MMWGLVNKWNWLSLPEQPELRSSEEYDLRRPGSDGLARRPTLYDDAL